MITNEIYNKSDKINRTRWMYAGLIVLGLIFFILQFEFTGGDTSPEAIEKRIKGSERLSRVDRLCKDLPKPGDFQFIDKQISGGSLEAALDFYFDTSVSYSEVRRFYLEWFNTQGWIKESSGDLWFRKGNQKISIFRGRLTDYTIYCAEDIY